MAIALSSRRLEAAISTTRVTSAGPGCPCRKIYVLHAFQKKSKKGIATAKYDVDLIKQRYKEAKELAAHEKDED